MGLEGHFILGMGEPVAETAPAPTVAAEPPVDAMHDAVAPVLEGLDVDSGVNPRQATELVDLAINVAGVESVEEFVRWVTTIAAAIRGTGRQVRGAADLVGYVHASKAVSDARA